MAKKTKKSNVLFPTVIREALHNLSLSENGNHLGVSESMSAFYKGLVIGIVSTLMAVDDADFWTALRELVKNMPKDRVDPVLAFPKAWIEDVKSVLEEIDQSESDVC